MREIRRSDPSSNSQLYLQIRELIEGVRNQVVVKVNQSLTLLNWNIGRLIHDEVLQDSRASYGKEILATLSQDLKREYGRGYNYSSLTRMLKFYRSFPEEEIIATVSQQLTWSHFVELVTIEENLRRDFYLQMAIAERWSVRLLRD